MFWLLRLLKDLVTCDACMVEEAWEGAADGDMRESLVATVSFSAPPWFTSEALGPIDSPSRPVCQAWVNVGEQG